MILQHCPNLIDMSFEDALINEYKPALCVDSEIIEHNNLEILEITTSLEKISKNEYWILDFLTRGVSLNNLKIFTFWKNLKRPGHRPTLESNEVMELFGTFQDDNIVANFIIKHRDTIKNLWIGGNGFKLFNSNLSPSNLESLRKIQLDSLTCTFNGESLSHQILLEQQRNLKKFILFSRFTVPKANTDAAGGFMTRVINCLSRNSQTLTEVIIYPKIVFENKDRQELLEDNFLENFTINCDIFSHCKSLENLAIGLLCFENLDGNAEGWPTILGTRILNMHRVPSNLRELQIFVEDYDKKDLHLLGRS
ncbi:unnamed protein product [Allacma fusca]|uniref:Uncharacterized protein n=1 Tax=Allacma fusca TaxID=39272 RepID=A0A8J2LFF0_9HEXA|nr:unnamed protein product [Allacma fusca]